MTEIYTRILDKLDEYALKYGWDQGDLNWDNMLFSDDLTQVNLVE